MIKAEGLTRRFGARLAVEKVSFEVRPGEVFGLVGPNGAGKTTLVRLLTGVLAPHAGRAEVAGEDVTRRPEAVKARIGYATQDASVYPDLTVRENLEFRAALYLPPQEVPARVAEVLERFGLEPWQHRLAGELSGGWRQRLSLAQAFVHRPRVAFLDEPTTGLDPLARRAVWDLIYAEAARGVTVLVTTHYMDEAERCHRLGLIYRGRLVALETPQALKAAAQARYRFFQAPAGTDLEALKARPGILDAWPSGAGVRGVARSDAALEDLEVVPPTLEDVFSVLVMEEEARA
ncbi:heme ABC exporter ATP-binding protein CcmA [Marinithermus hydrothermalis]|uniref:Heme exporter protein CcmA n=1 Tax=Marinithermus hydrothermalis (strain DSM 14884 / JCM 11576 / T1) TaxID=869210 RepID=F2NNG7_MARHT|nr:heme ABC exporter ATP-binding protein CcmA [Marinithermus hydrothermalis]AEB10777.1 heme exporter protein CcmA [Marinithermus hydrothermalis DSM 14884]